MKPELYEKVTSYLLEHQDKFFRLAYSYVHNSDSAMDIVQNSILKALENYTSMRNPDAIRTWFYRILVNECLTFFRKTKYETSYEPEYFIQNANTCPDFETGIVINQFLDTLKPETKTVILLHYYEGLTLTEISSVTGVNLSTIKYRLYAGLRSIKRHMKEVSL